MLYETESTVSTYSKKEHKTEAESVSDDSTKTNVWPQEGEAAGGHRKLHELCNLYCLPNTIVLGLENWGGESGEACSMHTQFGQKSCRKVMMT
jgi:hypothetical protein